MSQLAGELPYAQPLFFTEMVFDGLGEHQDITIRGERTDGHQATILRGGETLPESSGLVALVARSTEFRDGGHEPIQSARFEIASFQWLNSATNGFATYTGLLVHAGWWDPIDLADRVQAGEVDGPRRGRPRWCDGADCEDGKHGPHWVGLPRIPERRTDVVPVEVRIEVGPRTRYGVVAKSTQPKGRAINTDGMVEYPSAESARSANGGWGDSDNTDGYVIWKSGALDWAHA